MRRGHGNTTAGIVLLKGGQAGVIVHDILGIVTVALLEDARRVVTGHVETASEHVVRVATERSGAVAWEASAEAKVGSRHEVHPFGRLDVVGVHHSAHGVSGSLGTVRVQLSSLVAGSNADLCKVSVARHLNVVGRLDEVCAGDRSLRNEPRAVARFGAVGYDAGLEISNATSVGRRVDAEVGDGVDVDHSRHGVGILC